MRYLIGRPRTPTEIDEFWRPRCEDTADDAMGLGRWVGFRDGDFLGWWDLESIGSSPNADIGWRLERRHWRQGLATEGTRELLRHGFETVRLELVRAETMAVNAGSRGVMRRLGMRHIRTEVRHWEHPLPGAEEGEVTYEITAADWVRLRDGHGWP
jgi:RimJ/RimL family protein N-acetyltransferase